MSMFPETPPQGIAWFYQVWDFFTNFINAYLPDHINEMYRKGNRL